MTQGGGRRAHTLWLPVLLAGCVELPPFVPLRAFDAGALDAVTPGDIDVDEGAAATDEVGVDEGAAVDAGRDEGPGVERCNGRDDDGDGAVDEDSSPMTPCLRGEGRCAIDGVQTCREGELRCVGAFIGAGPERCNAEDDDCDGTVDEGFDLRRVCLVGEGVCAGSGFVVCRDDGTAGCNAEPDRAAQSDERCDGLDNDCDGATDEGDGITGRLSRPCIADDAEGECRHGTQECTPSPDDGGATWGRCAPSVGAATDVCDGRDEDCDGIVDNGFDIGQPCFIALLEGGVCGQQGTFQCTADGRNSECRPRPETECNGLDDNCDGVIDDGLACADLITRECRAWLGWTIRELDSPGDTWGTCPAMPELAADLSCNGSGPGADFGQIELFGDVDAADDRLGVRFGCRANASLLVDYIAGHCALYLGVAAADSAPPDGADTWSSCPDEPVGGDADAACTSGDARFRPMPLPIDLDEGAVLGAAFRCADASAPRRAEAMAGAVEVLIAWADASLDEPAPDWEAICAPGGDGDARTACVATGGDGRFHAMPFTADVDLGDKLAIGIRPRPAP